ncbi:MAG: HAD family hydrolase [Dehalococcoidia bacterium]
MTLDAILFDFDDTLSAEDESVATAFLAVGELARQQSGVDPERLINALRQRAGEMWRGSPFIGYCRSIGFSSWEGLGGLFDGSHSNAPGLVEWIPDYRHGAWVQALAAVGIQDEAFADELAAAFVEQGSGPHVPYPDAEQTLTELAGHCRMAIVTNGFPSVQRTKVEKCGLGHFFEAVVVSGDIEIGVGKPDPRPFLSALEALGADPSRTAMIGNSLTNDVAGAQKLGLHAIWVNRTDENPGEARPDAEISSLSELPGLLYERGLLIRSTARHRS